VSLFLGKIHYWLYNKILMCERIEEEIIERVKDKDNGIDDLVKHINHEFGAPTGKKMLEEIIDTSNIHGWLQQRIESAELRQAALITQLLQWSSSYKVELLKIYTKQGEDAAHGYENTVVSPEEIFNALNDFILEGMPCDRVNKVNESNNNEFSWETSMCLHKSYWDRVGGDIRNFYELREVWIKAFVKTINSEFKYEKSESGLNRIIRQK
jgi:hypothetical protein